MTTKPPPSSLRAPPPSSGSGKYLIIMLLLGGGLVGLYFVKGSTADPQPAIPPSASAAVVAAHAPHPDPVDIPPPPPAIPDATPDTGATKTVVSSGGVGGVGGGGGGDGCAQTSCNGSAGTELQNALAFRAKTAHKCYDEALSQDSTLKGQVVIGVKISGNGTVCSSSVVSSEVTNPSVAGCIANRFRQGARLPSPVGGCVEVNVPMKLLPPR